MKITKSCLGLARYPPKEARVEETVVWSTKPESSRLYIMHKLARNIFTSFYSTPRRI